MCMITRGHFVTIKIFPGGGGGNQKVRGNGKGTGGSCSLPFSSPPLASPVLFLDIWE